MDTQLKVIKVIQNNYVYKFKKIKKVSKSLFGTVACFLLVISLYTTFRYINEYRINEIYGMATYISNPINPLYSDMGNVVFTSNDGVVILDNKQLEFSVPVIYKSYRILDKSIEFEVGENPIISSIEKGVVSDIYVTSNNVKCIKIKHSNNMFSIIENVDILGVNIGAMVSKNQKIGTAKNDINILLSIEKSGEKIPLYINGNNVCLR